MAHENGNLIVNLSTKNKFEHTIIHQKIKYTLDGMKKFAYDHN